MSAPAPTADAVAATASRRDLPLAAALGFVADPLDRESGTREDLGYLAATAREPGARVLVLAGEVPVLRRLGEAFEPRHALGDADALGPPEEAAYLGRLDGAPLFARRVPEAAELAARDDLALVDLRSVAVRGLVPPDLLGPLGEAKALFHWHRTHRFCGVCGAATAASPGGFRRECRGCGAQHFPRTDPVVIMLAVRGDACLLGRQPRFPPGMWSALAGFLEPGETVESAVRRETMEEAGVPCGRVRYLASQPWPFPASLMLGCLAEALGEIITVDREELEDARWFPRAEVAAMLERRHPKGLQTPPPMAIAHALVRAFVDGEGA